MILYYTDVESTCHLGNTAHFRWVFLSFNVAKCIPYDDDDDDDDDDGVIGKLFISVCKHSKIRSVSSSHSRFVGLFVFKAS